MSRVLTGITTTGIPHLGNYAGAIRPCIEASRLEGVDSYFFMADYHALIKCADPQRVAMARLQIAATWLASGLDPNTVTFYCQSDIPEIPELNWLLSCVTQKGLMNRAHAYKACVDQNAEKGVDSDDGVTMGLFCYPVLMAADILMFKANKVPVGRDQIQHIEMARDIAQRFNHLYQGDYFVLPEVQIAEDVALLPGLDGRKMSKSYDNTIPLFEGGQKALKEAVMRIQTDSKLPGEPKDPDNSHLFTLYKAFATKEQTLVFREALKTGMGWGDAKNEFLSLLENMLAPMRDQYMDLMSRPDDISDILLAGAKKARLQATPFMNELREAVGLRSMKHLSTAKQEKTQAKKSKSARFVSFREEGMFFFRLIDEQGVEQIVSKPFEKPQDAGSLMKKLQSPDSLSELKCQGDALIFDGQTIAQITGSWDALMDALKSFSQN
ncbi:tryptophan--tRNA ligase [Basilea psittacipulmonis]|uniref:Tryptophan--tRNA ligase n=1 Tax=Basilea psittacipulmonis DSM 24701 TaxID=1072685 RepID=A0A077DI16_9BURK|nr:tryptophan--tRNA ligase [Basilea psittacipulmonis]AIL33167.1 tryptophan--tRNA ligase [Basilea psittacipulmonis DSM 24701]